MLSVLRFMEGDLFFLIENRNMKPFLIFKLHPNEDKELTCLFCGRKNCDCYYEMFCTGDHRLCGVHSSCIDSGTRFDRSQESESDFQSFARQMQTEDWSEDYSRAEPVNLMQEIRKRDSNAIFEHAMKISVEIKQGIK